LSHRKFLVAMSKSSEKLIVAHLVKKYPVLHAKPDSSFPCVQQQRWKAPCQCLASTGADFLTVVPVRNSLKSEERDTIIPALKFPMHFPTVSWSM
jgi:hypothetical protein